MKYAEEFRQAVELVAFIVDAVLVVFKFQEQPPKRRTVAGIGHTTVINRHRVAQAPVNERYAVELSRTLVGCFTQNHHIHPTEA